MRARPAWPRSSAWSSGAGHEPGHTCRSKRIIPASIAQTVHSILTTVVQSGTGTSASISGVDVAGKTGTTTNYGDAWFVGWTPQITTAVWVGFPNKLVPMTTDFNGGPVEGGTYPAIIWHDFMTQALQIQAGYQTAKPGHGSSTTITGGTGTTAAPAPTSAAPGQGTGTSSTPLRQPERPAARHGRRQQWQRTRPGAGGGNAGAGTGGNAGGGTPGGHPGHRLRSRRGRLRGAARARAAAAAAGPESAAASSAAPVSTANGSRRRRSATAGRRPS